MLRISILLPVTYLYSAHTAIASGYFYHRSGSVIPATSVMLITHAWFSSVIQIIYTNKKPTTVAIKGNTTGDLKADRHLC